MPVSLSLSFFFFSSLSKLPRKNKVAKKKGRGKWEGKKKSFDNVQLSAVDSLDGGDGAAGDGLQLGVGGRQRAARVAVRRHPELRVRVPVHVHLDALLVADGAHLGR